MSAAAILVCTTLITNAGNGSIVTRECHAVEPQSAVAAPASADINTTPSPASITTKETSLEPVVGQDDVAVPKPEPATTIVKPAEVVAKPAAAVVKPAKPKRTGFAKYVPHHKMHKTSRGVGTTPEAYAILQPALRHRPPKKPTVWAKVRNLFNQ